MQSDTASAVVMQGGGKMKKIYCNPIFDKEKWKNQLDDLHIRAEIIGEDNSGWFELEFDEVAFKKIKIYEMPHFLYLNRKWMLGED